MSGARAEALSARGWKARTALLLLGAALLLMPALGAAPLERAEVYFLDAARAMVERGDYLVPHYRGQPFFDKPALTYWLMAGSFRLFGFTAAAARSVPALAAVLVLAVTVWLGRTLLGRGAGLAGGVVLATTGAFMAFGRIAMSDMLLTLWSTLAVALAARAMAPWGPASPGQGDERPAAWPWVPLVGAALGLGFLTKGPVAVLLPGLGIAVLCWSRRGRDLPVTRGALLAAAAAFALLGLGWFVLVGLRLGAEPLRHFFLRENLERFSGETYDAGRAPWYYLVTYLGEGLPWSLFLPLAAWSALRQGGATAGAGDGVPRGSRVLLVWAALMAVPLSLSRGKLDYYLLPLYPALSLGIGACLAGGRWGARERAWSRAVLVACAALLAALPLAAGVFPPEWLPPPPLLLPLGLLPGLGALACAWAAFRPRAALVTGTLAAVSAVLFLAAAAAFVPAYAAAQPHARLASDVARERRYRPEASVLVCEDEGRVQREILFRARVAVQEECELWAAAASPHPFLLLLRPQERASLSAIEGLREVGTYRYLPATALTLRGLLRGSRPAELSLMANFATTDPVAETKRKRDRKRALRAAEGR